MILCDIKLVFAVILIKRKPKITTMGPIFGLIVTNTCKAGLFSV